MQLTDDSKMPFGQYKGSNMEDVPASTLLYYWEEYSFWKYKDRDINTLKTNTDINNKLVADYTYKNLIALMKEAKDFIVDHK